MNANKHYDLFHAPARYLNYLMPLPAFPLIKLIKQISNTRSKSQTMRTNLILFSHLTLLPASNRAPKSDRDGFVQSTILHPQYTYIHKYTHIHTCSTYLYTFSIDICTSISRPRSCAFALFVLHECLFFPSQLEIERDRVYVQRISISRTDYLYIIILFALVHLVFDCQMHFNEFKLQCDSDSLDHLLINAAMVCPLYID